MRGRVTVCQVRSVAAQYDHVLVPGWYIYAPPVAVVRFQNAAALAPRTAVQPLDFHARDLAPVLVALERRFRVAELTPECVRDVYAHALGAVERTRQRLALVPDARVPLGILRIEPETRLVHHV